MECRKRKYVQVSGYRQGEGVGVALKDTCVHNQPINFMVSLSTLLYMATTVSCSYVFTLNEFIFKRDASGCSLSNGLENGLTCHLCSILRGGDLSSRMKLALDGDNWQRSSIDGLQRRNDWKDETNGG
ncbi:transmembrane protein, putative [Medicago truncatula]|uniref:Transmembrane protein, putative n=1 Tax=Medicago truncatula TaxID=3880 RepID=A0A072UW03_MEDTR|nr:transmembrane protein, putative [Medicago truncatula]